MPGTSDPLNVAAEKLLMKLGENDDLIDEAAAATYEGDYLSDLVSSKVEDVIRVTQHNEDTYAKIAMILSRKLYDDALKYLHLVPDASDNV